MRVGVWGAGNLGVPLVRRLLSAPWASEVHWTTRDHAQLQPHIWDLEHGLALSPCCHRIEAHPQPTQPGEGLLGLVDVLVITAGGKVPKGGSRDDVYAQNRGIFRSTILPVLQGFGGIVVVVTNPVDLMARLVHVEGGLAAERVLGLGTVVETARLRFVLSDLVRPARSPRDIFAFAVGTHDEHFVPIHTREAVAPHCDPERFADICRVARGEVARAAERVKRAQQATVHPIVEGVVSVLEGLATDRRSLLTVSTLDSADPDRLFYSVPCVVGAAGVIERHHELLEGRMGELAPGKENLRRLLRQIP